MTTPDQLNHAPPARADEGGAKSALRQRVRSLSLGGRDGSAGKRGAAPPSRVSMIPWVLCFVMLVVTCLFGYRAYRAR